MSAPAEAFSRGLTAKVRSLQQKAYEERFRRAQEACAKEDFAGCAAEARLAVGHAADEKSAAAAQKLLKLAESRA